ncbi:unnamed protein product [Penicillium salamii]|uniref:Uncharacterized protein n=1 Tax=Penicillium salamii TaxID=1612424 RepID=A0A9W4IRB5_9EURO|nr:unnamed protein product [Penicillium salamii]CAG8061773.1 unnamed protein product [Penicillium salamii]CAG8068380.1 unnamed protein product [Penicillium salamii]CAG8241867.1 unnamed protein product [Penicillium salamii]CAG8263978.1 unnamed protein product [Penicillium salamii]
MLFSAVSFVLLLAGGAVADLHNVAVCVTGRKYSEVGGTPFSVSYTWSKDYEILPDATKCACDLYKQRNTGDKQWDQCPDCTFDGNYCNSAAWHIGGDEMTYYCEKMCHAQGAEGN